MKRGLLMLPLLTISILLLLPIQSIQATGPTLIEGPDGFNVGVSNSSTYIVTVYEEIATFNVSDKIRYNITTANNSQTGFLWITDTLWGTIKHYNSYLDSWGDISGGAIQTHLISGYNSTNTWIGSWGGSYNCYINGIPGWGLGPVPNKIPNNFTAANYSIVFMISGYLNNTLMYTTVLSSTPTPPNIAGTWSIWSSDGFSDTRFDVVFNTNGICTRFTEYGGVPGNWIKAKEFVLVGAGEGEELDLSLLLLGMMAGGGGGMGSNEILIIAGIVGAIVVIIIIIAVSKSKS